MQTKKTNVDYDEKIPSDNYFKQNWKHNIIYGNPDQRSCFLMTGSQGCGKSSLLISLIKHMSGKSTKIFWVSDVGKLDQKIEKEFKHSDIQWFSSEHVQQGFFQELHQYLIKNKKDKPKKYYQNILVLDDIQLTNKQQDQLIILLRTYRHLHLSVFFLCQSFVGGLKKNIRELFQIQIYFSGFSRDRLFNTVYPQIRGNYSKEFFRDCYDDAISQPFGFLVVNSKSPEKSYLQKGFEQVYIEDHRQQ